MSDHFVSPSWVVCTLWVLRKTHSGGTFRETHYDETPKKTRDDETSRIVFGPHVFLLPPFSLVYNKRSVVVWFCTPRARSQGQPRECEVERGAGGCFVFLPHTPPPLPQPRQQHKTTRRQNVCCPQVVFLISDGGGVWGEGWPPHTTPIKNQKHNLWTTNVLSSRGFAALARLGGRLRVKRSIAVGFPENGLSQWVF
jgi:hypothetical protein